MTPNGKVDRKALSKVDISINSAEYVAPENDIQQRVINIWSDLLKIEKIGILDNFFELGGNSIVATRVIAKINLTFKTDYPLDFLFHVSTIKGISHYIENGYDFNQEYYVFGNMDAEKTIFAFPPGLGYGTAYKELFHQQDEFKVVSFNYLENEEDMIIHYAQIIQALQPNGDLLFFGWSAGGNLAYEIEKILNETHSRIVSNTIMIDSYADNEHWIEDDFDDLDDFVKYDLGLKDLVERSANVLHRVKERMFDYCKMVHSINYNYKSMAKLYFIKAAVPLAKYNWENLYSEIEYLQGEGGHYDMLKEEFMPRNKEIILEITNQIMKSDCLIENS